MASADSRISFEGCAPVSPPPAIVLVTSSFPISGDGSEAAGAFVADLCDELAKQIPVRVVAPGRDNAVQSWSKHVKVFRYRTPDQPLSTLRSWHPADALEIVRVMASGARATERAVSAGKTSHVIALWALPCGEWARRSARRHGVGYSVWTLGSDIWSLGRIPVVRGRLRTILAGATHCWSDGLKLLEDTRALAGRDVAFLPSTRRIERARLEPARREPPYRFLFLGRWHPNKGIDLLLEALEHLSEADWEHIERVVVAGGGPLEAEVSVAVQRLHNSARPVELWGFLAGDEAQDVMLASDYLLIPSRIESIPVVFSDAMKLGLPVIATPVGDFPGLFATRPAPGILAGNADAMAIRQAIREAISVSPAVYADGTATMASRFDVAVSARAILAGMLNDE